MGVRKFILKIPQPYLRSENYYARKILRPLPRLKLPGMLRCDLGLTPSNLTVANRRAVPFLIRLAPEILLLVACSLLLACFTYYAYPIR